jgi:class 3 adenylate cyclase/tetratricopeptide (TPR) repeat protein
VAAVEGREQRKTVTVLFCDVTGSTALGESTDPEALRALLARYFERMKTVVESHGGTVEKFIGDAVMAVFGVPVAHEDDALRAVRAAVEMRDALPELGVQARIGVNTGEVVTGTEERLATGDAVNVAARLEQAAGPGEVFLGAETMRLVAAAVDADSVEPLELKGKRESVPAFRLLRVGESPERVHGDVFVGRERELDEIAAAWALAGAEQRCRLVSIVAEAGVGKTRLAAEALARLNARVVRARCLSYGEGITYWPVVEVVKQLAARPSDPAAAAAIASLFGETEARTSAEEIAWAFRKLLEEQAPLVCLFEDIHWGEETFLDLVEHVALLSAGAQVLLLCTARPDLLERRHSWPVTFRLGSLEPEDVDRLLPAMLPAALREQIVRAAGGNPLFVTEMVAMATSADGEVAVPPTLRALLTARLDQVDAAERRVLERGAVEGEVFHRGAVQALAPGEQQVTARLAGLVRRELVRPDRAHIPGEDGFRFRHLLIRDAAYEALSKSARADLHSRFADWLEKTGAALVELDEILGHHLEQAARYRAELGQADPELARRAGERLAAAGRRALLREDYAAATNLLERSAAVSPEELDVFVEDDLVFALGIAGRIDEAARRAARTAERAAAAGNANAELCFRIAEMVARLYSDPEGVVDALEALALEAIPRFRAAGDDLGLCTANFAVGMVAHWRMQGDIAAAAFEQTLAHARRLGLRYRDGYLNAWIAASRVNGTTPVPDLIAWLEEEDAQGRLTDPSSRTYLAIARAMAGQIEEARAQLAAVRELLAERGMRLYVAERLAMESVFLELLAGDPAAAVELGTVGCRLLEELGERAWLSTAAGYLAQALYELDRLDEAEAWADRSRELGASDDLATQALWRQAKAKVLARRGNAEEAEQMAGEAVAITEPTQELNSRADSLLDLGTVLKLIGKPEDGRLALARALELYERKGNIVMAERIRTRLSEASRSV